MGGAEHEAGEVAQRRERRLRLAEELERGERVSVAEPHRLLFRPLAGLDGAAPEPTFDPIDARAGETRVGGAQESVQHSAAATLPGESKQREQGAPELGLIEGDPTFDRIWHTERAERGLQRRAVALDARTDECDLLRRGSAADQREQLFGDSLEGAASAGALEEAEGAVQRYAARAGIALVREERTLEVRQRARPDLGPRRQLLDPRPRQRGQVGGGALQRREGRASGLVRERHRDLSAARKRLQQRPLRTRQVLEAVCEHGASLPRSELAGEPLRRRAALEVAIPEPEAVEFRAVLGVEPGEISVELARVDEPGLELAEGGRKRVGEAGEARRPRPAVQARLAECAPDDQGALRVGRDGTMLAAVSREPSEEVVERPDLAAEQGSARGQEVALDSVDVRPVRHDQEGLVRKLGQVALEQERHLARIRGPGEQREGHRPILVPPSDGIFLLERDSRAGPTQQRIWAGGRAAPPHGPASRRRSCRRDRPVSSRDAHRNS